MGPSVPEMFRVDFSPKWVHLCRRYLRVIFFHLSRTMLEILRNDFFTQVGPSVPEIFKDEFFVQVGPFVPGEIFALRHLQGSLLSPVWHGSYMPEILMGVIFYTKELGTVCARKVRSYLDATIIVESLFCQFPPWTCCCCPRFSLLFACLCFYIFIRFVAFCLLVASFLFFPFSDMFQSEMWCEFFAAFPNHLQPLVSCVQETVLLRKRKAPFVLIWLVLSAGSFGLRLTVFATCLPIRFMLRPNYSAWFLKPTLLLLYLMLFQESTGLNAWLVCRRSPTILLFLPWLVHG